MLVCDVAYLRIHPLMGSSQFMTLVVCMYDYFVYVLVYAKLNPLDLW